MNTRILSIAAFVLASVASASAVSVSAFNNSNTVSGVSLTLGANNSIAVSMTSLATFTGAGNHTNAAIKDIFGVYAFATGGGHFTNEPGAAATVPNQWGFTNNHVNLGRGVKKEDLVGYDDNAKKNPITSSNPLTFSFTTTNNGAMATTTNLAYGLHVRLTDGNTYYVTTGAAQAVPEPASMAALGLGAIGFLKRRKKA